MTTPSPPSDPADWLASEPRIALYGRIRRPAEGFWRRLFGDDPEPAIAQLAVDRHGLRSSLTPQAELAWAEPFALQVSAWHELGELAVRLRPRGGGEVGFRTLAPADWLEALGAPSQQSLHPFVLPEDVAPLWNALRFYAQVHALPLALPSWPEPDAALLARGSAEPSQLCMACEGYLLAPLGPGAYRCLQCGYEGGEGYGALDTIRRLEAIAALTGEARSAHLLGALEEARFALLAAIGDHAIEPGTGKNENQDLRGLRESNLTARVLEAAQKLREACVLAEPGHAPTLRTLTEELFRAAQSEAGPGLALLERATRTLEPLVYHYGG